MVTTLYPDMETNVSFLRSFDDKTKADLFDSSLAVLYSPENEHFGIVPLEGKKSRCFDVI